MHRGLWPSSRGQDPLGDLSFTWLDPGSCPFPQHLLSSINAFGGCSESHCPPQRLKKKKKNPVSSGTASCNGRKCHPMDSREGSAGKATSCQFDELAQSSSTKLYYRMRKADLTPPPDSHTRAVAPLPPPPPHTINKYKQQQLKQADSRAQQTQRLAPVGSD